MKTRNPALAAACAAIFLIPAACTAQEAPASTTTTDASAPVVACTVVDRARVLPEAVRETSGLVESRTTPGEFWTHNDSGNTPEIFALTSEGKVSKRVQIQGAQFEDWEDTSTEYESLDAFPVAS